MSSRLSGAVAVAFAAFGLGAGCVADSGKPVVILEAERVTAGPADSSSACAPPPASGTPLDEGTLDVGLDRDYPYMLYPAIQNRLPSRVEDGFEQNEVQLTGASVEIEGPAGLAIPWTSTCTPKFDLPLSRRITPSTEAVLQLEAMRTCQTTILHSLFTSGALSTRTNERVVFRIKVKVKAKHGGSTITSDEFALNVRVCYGCMHGGYSGSEFAAYDFQRPGAALLSCDKVGPTFVNPYQGNRCGIAQDNVPILCCARGGNPNDLVCPAPSAATTGM